jgi:hypothetical protein
MKNNAGEELVRDLHEIKNGKLKQSVRSNPLVCIARGAWIFAEGTAQLGGALFMVWQGRYGHFPQWGRTTLTVAGVLILVPAGWLLGKFFRSVGEAK